MPENKSAAVHIKREYAPPDDLRSAIRAYMALTKHYDNHGIDPRRESRRDRMLRNGPVRISSIAQADEPLPIGRVGVDSHRRLWRFRACDMATGRCVYERIVEAETFDEARHVGTAQMTGKDWHCVLEATGGNPPAALMGSALAV